MSDREASGTRDIFDAISLLMGWAVGLGFCIYAASFWFTSPADMKSFWLYWAAGYVIGQVTSIRYRQIKAEKGGAA